MHINLILDEERRSTSPVSLGLIIRLAVIVVSVLAIVGIFSFFAAFRSLQYQVSSMDDEWRRIEPNYKEAVRVRNDLAERTATLNGIKGWRDSRIAWGKQLGEFQLIVPAVVQLTDLRVSQTILSLSNNISARSFEMRIAGKTAAPQSEANVVQFLDAFKQPPFARDVESAVLPPGSFRQDPVSKTDRCFEIICKFVPRALE